MEWNALIVWSLHGSGVEAIKSLAKEGSFFYPCMFVLNYIGGIDIFTYVVFWHFERGKKSTHIARVSGESVGYNSGKCTNGCMVTLSWKSQVNIVKLLHQGCAQMHFIEAGTVVIINEGLHYEFVCFWKHQANLGGKMNTLHYR